MQNYPVQNKTKKRHTGSDQHSHASAPVSVSVCVSQVKSSQVKTLYSSHKGQFIFGRAQHNKITRNRTQQVLVVFSYHFHAGNFRID